MKFASCCHREPARPAGRSLRLLALAASLLALPAARAADGKFDFDALRDRARALAAQPPAPRPGDIPGWLKQLSYDCAVSVKAPRLPKRPAVVRPYRAISPESACCARPNSAFNCATSVCTSVSPCVRA